MAAEIQYENGNVHSPVILIGEDPSDENNVLISRLPLAISVPKDSVSDTEGTPEPETEDVA